MNTYVNGMKLQSVKIEAVGGEQLAGRFAIDLKAEDWSTAYATNTNISPSDKSSSLTLNCNNVALTNEATNLYVAVAFGTYAQGLKVTFNVIGDNDKIGEMVRTIGGSGITIARNTMLSMPPVAVTPTDIATEKYQLISSVEELAAGNYYMAGKTSAGLYALTTGTLSGGQMITTNASAFTNDMIDVTNATLVTLEAVNGKEDFYTIKMNDTQYLGTNDGKNKLILSNDKYEWKATDGSTAGVVFIYHNESFNYPNIYLASSTTASSKYVRGYTGTQNTGVFFFKKL